MKCLNKTCFHNEAGNCKFDHIPSNCGIFIPSDEQAAVESSAPELGSVSKLDQAALNTVAADMRKTAMKYVSAKDNARLMRAAELLALAIEKDASRIGAQGLMKQNVSGSPAQSRQGESE